MKKIALITYLIIATNIFSQGKGFVINGTIKQVADNSYIYLTHKYNDATFIDSTKVSGEKFTFKGKTLEPNMYWITLKRIENPALIFFADNTNITVNARADSMTYAKVKGGTTQDEYKLWLGMQSKFMETRQGLIMKYNEYGKANDQANAKGVMDIAMANEQTFVKDIVGFIKSHPKSCIGGYIIFSATFDWPKVVDYEEMYNALSEPVKKCKFGKLAEDKYVSVRGVTVGYAAINFTLPDLNGKEVSLSSYKGKYVLVDFWASWCGPCRGENPAVVAAYQKYKDKGFDILGVSLDSNKDKWKQAVEKDNLTWTHVSDLKGWQSDVAHKYGVTSIPFNVLLDKDGKIVAKALRGAALEAELAKIFDK